MVYMKGGAGNPRSYPVSNIMNEFHCWVCGKKCKGLLYDFRGKVCLDCDLLTMEDKEIKYQNRKEDKNMNIKKVKLVEDTTPLIDKKHNQLEKEIGFSDFKDTEMFDIDNLGSDEKEEYGKLRKKKIPHEEALHQITWKR